MAVPTLGTWEGLTIDRCDLSSPGFSAIEVGKVAPYAAGLLLDPDAISLSFDEWRKLRIQNRLQWSLLSGRLYQVTHTLMDRAIIGTWCVPNFRTFIRRSSAETSQEQLMNFLPTYKAIIVQLFTTASK